MTALYPTVGSCGAAGTKACEYVMVPVAQQGSTNSKNTVPVLASLRRVSAKGGSNSYIAAQMTADAEKCQAPNSVGTGL